MFRLTTAISLCLLAPATMAAAQCLSADALEGGITIEYASGSRSFIQRTESGTILDAHYDRYDYDIYGQVVMFETIDGVFETRRDTHTKDSWEHYDLFDMDYSFSPEAARPYTPGSTGNGVMNQHNDRRGVTEIAFGWSVYPSEPLVVGECSYEAVRVFTTEFNLRRGESYVREIKYLPELGFGIQIGNSYFAMPASNGDIISMTPS